MKTTTLLILISGSFLCPSAMHAKVGENESQIDHRYGKPVGKWDDYIGYKKLYHWHGYDVMVTFVDSVSQREMFNRTDGILDPRYKKFLTKFSGVGQNGIIRDEDSDTFTTKEFLDKYAAARAAAWAKSEQSDKR